MDTSAGAKVLGLFVWGAALALSLWVAFDLYGLFSRSDRMATTGPASIDPREVAEMIGHRHLMGRSGEAENLVPDTNSDRFALQAVVTGSLGTPGWAMISVDDGAQTGVVEGREVVPGVSLTRVSADHVVLESGGAKRVLRFATAESASASGTPDSKAGAKVTEDVSAPVHAGHE